jgi:putative ABC transport system permease protein
MRFLALILKNLLRRKTRSSLTILGISIGVATIIALGAVMSGMTSGMKGILKTGKADFSVVQSGVSDLSFSRISENRTGEIEELDGVRKAVGVLWSFFSIEENPFFLVWGFEEEDLATVGLNIVNGSSFAQEYELIIGEAASKELSKTVGDKLILREREFNITGVFETGALFLNNGAALSLKKLQEMENQEGYVTMVYVEREEGANIDELCQRIEENFSDLITIKSVSELGKVDKGLEVMDAVNWAVSFLAILIGGIGVTNTMIMSIYERTREIGVLRAVGWKRKRILSMVLGESILLCLFSVPIGSLLGICGVKILLLQPVIKGLLEPIYTMDTFARAFIVASAVGLIGGLYPAYRASKLSPGEALRYE